MAKKRYRAWRQAEQGLTTHADLSKPAQALLGSLNRETAPNGQRWVDRTSVTKKHFRLVPGLAEVIGVPTIELAGTPPTEPPTETCRVHEMLDGIERFADGSELTPTEMVESIGRMLACRAALRPPALPSSAMPPSPLRPQV